MGKYQASRQIAVVQGDKFLQVNDSSSIVVSSSCSDLSFESAFIAGNTSLRGHLQALISSPSSLIAVVQTFSSSLH